MITKTLTTVTILFLANTAPIQLFAEEIKIGSQASVAQASQQIARPAGLLPNNITPIQTNEPKLKPICVPASICINGIRIDSLRERPPVAFSTPKLNR